MWWGVGARGAGARIAAPDRRKNNEWYETAQKSKLHIGPHNLKGLNRSKARHDSRLKKIRAPTLLVHGEEGGEGEILKRKVQGKRG